MRNSLPHSNPLCVVWMCDLLRSIWAYYQSSLGNLVDQWQKPPQEIGAFKKTPDKSRYFKKNHITIWLLHFGLVGWFLLFFFIIIIGACKTFCEWGCAPYNGFPKVLSEPLLRTLPAPCFSALDSKLWTRQPSCNF